MSKLASMISPMLTFSPMLVHSQHTIQNNIFVTHKKNLLDAMRRVDTKNAYLITANNSYFIIVLSDFLSTEKTQRSL